MLVLKTVIYKSKRLDFQNFTSLVLDDFKKTLEKKVVSLLTLNINEEILNRYTKCKLSKGY